MIKVNLLVLDSGFPDLGPSLHHVALGPDVVVVDPDQLTLHPDFILLHPKNLVVDLQPSVLC